MIEEVAESSDRQIFGLVDCNNFYASCERLFDPSLRGKAVVVLSNNDGVIVARSNEAKALGIGMAEPLFKWRKVIEKNRVKVLSSNYQLYGDLSGRVFSVLSRYTPAVEVYSIDEAFLDLTGMERVAGDESLIKYGQQIRQTVGRWTGIPVSIGIAPTRTLAKLANYAAKGDESRNGVVSFLDRSEIDRISHEADVRAVWGIGPASAEKLNRKKIETVAQFIELPETTVESLMGIGGVKVQRELRGISCIGMHPDFVTKKTITCSRSFIKPIDSYEEIRRRLSSYVATAAAKLRGQDSMAGIITVHISTSPFNKKQRHYSRSLPIRLPSPSDDTTLLIRYMETGLKKIFVPEIPYKKAGVVLSEFSNRSECQTDLFDSNKSSEKSSRLMEAIDSLNDRIGSGTMQMGTSLTNQKLIPETTHRSGSYTTRWSELKRIR
ncbi:MAG: Y-family DNA polymerase [bacterium]|nr:Y-family DNA polymerase [bacterium]